MGAAPQFSLPPLSALSFVPFILAQAILLHPVFSDRTSRRWRFVFMIPALYLSFVAPFRWRIEPAEAGVGANFRWGIFGPNFVMKALEWGLAQDRTPYVWLGFDSKAEVIQPNDNGKREIKSEPNVSEDDSHTPSSDTAELKVDTREDTTKAGLKRRKAVKAAPSDTLPTPPESPTLRAVGGNDVGSSGVPSTITHEHDVKRIRFSASHSHPLDILLDSLHLLSSMRYIGYAAGPPVNHLAPRPPQDKRRFAKGALYRFARSHVISTICLLFIIHRDTLVPSYLAQYLPHKTALPVAHALSYFAVGVSLHAQMCIGFEGASLFFLVLSLVPWPKRLRPSFAFDAREWTPLFWRPWDITSVSEFWAMRWHSLFRRPFLATGFTPAKVALTPVVGRKGARGAGAFAVFALSLWMHDQALISARHGLNPALFHPLSFTERYGAHMFFIGQGVAVMLESTYLSKAKFPTHLGARIWGMSWIVLLGCVAGRSWLAMGLADGLPTIEHWSWQRFALPTVALAPPPLFTR